MGRAEPGPRAAVPTQPSPGPGWQLEARLPGQSLEGRAPDRESWSLDLGQQTLLPKADCTGAHLCQAQCPLGPSSFPLVPGLGKQPAPSQSAEGSTQPSPVEGAQIREANLLPAAKPGAAWKEGRPSVGHSRRV